MQFHKQNNTNNTISVKNLNFSYGNERPLRDVNFNIEKGDFVGITGVNGSDKSALLKLILGFLEADSGETRFARGRNNFSFGYVPQNNHEKSIAFPITVWRIVTMNVVDGKNIKPYEKVGDALFIVEMKDKKNCNYNNMSGSEQERAMIAKALTNDPQILIFSRPTVGLGQRSKENLFDLLRHLNSYHSITILVVTHELDLTKDYFNRVFKLDNGFVEVKSV